MKVWGILIGISLIVFLGFVILINMPNRDAAPSAMWPKEQAMSHVTESQDVGSGYRDFEGLTLAYNYEGFGSFQLAFYDNRLKWRGFDFGYFDNIVAQVDPQVSKIADSIYFLSWNTPQGSDNVVVNFAQETVHAHLYGGPDSVDEHSAFDQIHGKILCGPSKDCAFPEGAPTGSLGMLYKFVWNSWKYDLPSMADYEPPLVENHAAGINDLSGTKLRYAGDNGAVSIEIEQDETRVSVNGGALKTFRTHATKIAHGVYLISWLDESVSGDHIVFNKNTMQIFDHVTSNAVRGEQIFTPTCFGPVSDC
ncbi:MAG: hypothetical protein Hens2KO_16490 [Henriciella sp.]